jgi:mono/diheme cytochrome c family protein
MKHSIKRTLNFGTAWVLLAIVSVFVLASCVTKAPPSDPNSAASIPLELFKASSNCAACHQGMEDSFGNDVSIHTEWQNSIMANAARDPYYFASVRMETQNSPQYAEAIEEKCATCHAPMALFTNTAAEEKTLLLGEQGVLAEEHPLYELAVDGVSCAVCHQIPANPADNLRNSGDLAIELDLSKGERPIYGALPISEQNVTIMKAASGYTAVQSEHVRESTVCASCHELYLNYIQADGTLSTGEDLFYEQTPYSEWLASDFTEKFTCQNCHMPPADGAAPISNITPDNLVDPFARHTFTGGNVFMLNVFKRFGEELGILGSPAGLDEHILRTEELLQNETATVFVSGVEQQADTLTFNVDVEVLTGHKFPTSFPSRRAWLHVTVSDAQGLVIFESGAYDETGKIFGNENDDNPLAFEPHYEIISASDQVQIFEPVMKNVLGEVTTIQMQAAGYLKDNRLLPSGFDKQNPPPVSAVIGNALQDATFTGGSDTVKYQVQTTGAQGPFTVQVDLLYQSVSYRWSQNVLDNQTEEAQTFGRMLDQTGNIPVIIASHTAETE